MSSGATITIQGLDRLTKKFLTIPEFVKTDLDAEMSAIAKEYESKAASAAPNDRGDIVRGITSGKEGEMKYEIVSQAPHSAYVEFGTKRKTRIPADLTQLAAQFKGKGGGGGKGFYDEILAWVKRKGITGTYSVKTRKRTGGAIDKQIEDEQTAFAIYINILRNGINAQPFFFPWLPWAKAEMKKRPQEVVNKALKR